MVSSRTDQTSLPDLLREVHFLPSHANVFDHLIYFRHLKPRWDIDGTKYRRRLLLIAM